MMSGDLLGVSHKHVMMISLNHHKVDWERILQTSADSETKIGEDLFFENWPYIHSGSLRCLCIRCLLSRVVYSNLDAIVLSLLSSRTQSCFQCTRLYGVLKTLLALLIPPGCAHVLATMTQVCKADTV